MHCVRLDNPPPSWVGRGVATPFSLSFFGFPPLQPGGVRPCAGTLDLLLDKALHLWPVKQNALAQLLRWLAVADGAKVKDLYASKSQ